MIPSRGNIMKTAWTCAGKLIGIVIFTLAIGASSPVSAQTASPVTGADVYQKRCAQCHDEGVSRAPVKQVLQTMSAARILRTLDFGLMMALAYPMNREERVAVADFLGTTGADTPVPPPAALCAAGMQPLSAPSP